MSPPGGLAGASDKEDSEVEPVEDDEWSRASVSLDGDEPEEEPATVHTRELRPPRRASVERPGRSSLGSLSTAGLFGSSADVSVHRDTPSQVVVTFSTESFVHFARTMMGAADTILKDRDRITPRGYIQDAERDHQDEDSGEKLSEDDAGSEPFGFLDHLGSDSPEPALDHRGRRPWGLQDRRQLRRMKESGWTDERAGAALRRSAGAVAQQWRKQRAAASD